MSWGKGIILVYVLFILGIGVLVYKSMTKNIDLVTENYYEKEIKYQDQIDKINNTNSLKEVIRVEAIDNSVIVNYPAGTNKISGDISFYKPSDAKEDFKIIIEHGTDLKQLISTEKLTKGLWKVQINWAMDGKEYFNEEKIMIQ